jgi:2-polyprenyl-6-methoxyphenol hydroxylase-like FAD-dependent oxidoreductase
MSVIARKPILISGAGLSSLLLAQALTRAKIPCVIFERDASVSFRAQGYRLRLSDEGLDAIEKSLGPEKFQEFWDKCGKTGGGGFSVVDAITGEVAPVGDQSGDEQGKSKQVQEKLKSRDGKIVGVARGEMRAQFMKGCESLIQWSRHVTGYELTDSGVHAVFADGSKSVEGEMLIGGEGIHSKIAKQVSGGRLKVYDTGARGIHGQAPTTAYRGLGEGVWRIMDDSNPHGGFLIMTNVRPGEMDEPGLQFGWTMVAVPGVIKAPGDNYSIIGKPAADLAKALTAKWDAKVKPLTDNMIESEAAFWKITCSTPGGVPQWENEPRVTVIGDAAHSMTPAGGIGANTAVRDSELLSRLLIEAGGYADGVTAAYEKEMRVYGSEAVGTSYGLATNLFRIRIDENSKTV